MTLEQEFQEAKRLGYIGTEAQFFKFKLLKNLDWADVYITKIGIETDIEQTEKRIKLQKAKDKIQKLYKEIQEIEV